MRDLELVVPAALFQLADLMGLTRAAAGLLGLLALGCAHASAETEAAACPLHGIPLEPRQPQPVLGPPWYPDDYAFVRASRFPRGAAYAWLGCVLMDEVQLTEVLQCSWCSAVEEAYFRVFWRQFESP